MNTTIKQARAYAKAARENGTPAAGEIIDGLIAENAALHENRHAREDVISGLKDEVEARTDELTRIKTGQEPVAIYKGNGHFRFTGKVHTIHAETPLYLEAGAQPTCQYCDGTGDVHGFDGEWRGSCTCEAGAQAAVPFSIWAVGNKVITIYCATKELAESIVSSAGTSTGLSAWEISVLAAAKENGK